MGNSSHSKPQPSARLTEARNSLKQRIAKKKPASDLPESLRARVDQKKQEKKNQEKNQSVPTPTTTASSLPSTDPIRQQVEAKKQEKKKSRNSLSQKLTNFRRKMRARGWLP